MAISTLVPRYPPHDPSHPADISPKQLKIVGEEGGRHEPQRAGGGSHHGYMRRVWGESTLHVLLLMCVPQLTLSLRHVEWPSRRGCPWFLVCP